MRVGGSRVHSLAQGGLHVKETLYGVGLNVLYFHLEATRIPHFDPLVYQHNTSITTCDTLQGG